MSNVRGWYSGIFMAFIWYFYGVCMLEMDEAGNFKYFNMKFTKNFGMHFEQIQGVGEIFWNRSPIWRRHSSLMLSLLVLLFIAGVVIAWCRRCLVSSLLGIIVQFGVAIVAIVLSLVR
ncbi:hypothetical protein C2G38_2186804 [Gigaspora rosea]|uniref:Uncharacterized protein n=1 Tax=Gigaspora rosea TaxID=44941 RepID=A0A397VCA6_9GLOM|nr:hypothetical protein C2G38_2186804 [Gigaspora rosea]